MVVVIVSVNMMLVLILPLKMMLEDVYFFVLTNAYMNPLQTVQ